jgi:hypothetical protein
MSCYNVPDDGAEPGTWQGQPGIKTGAGWKTGRIDGRSTGQTDSYAAKRAGAPAA